MLLHLEEFKYVAYEITTGGVGFTVRNFRGARLVLRDVRMQWICWAVSLMVRARASRLESLRMTSMLL
jgi:hypothetical protein